MTFSLFDLAFVGSLQPPTPLLLDLYPNAAAAYSLRQLRSGVTNVVRVRRSSDNTEQDFTATQVTDGTLTTFCGAGDGFVRTWYDQSGNGRHATQANQADQPRIVLSGSLELESGKPTLDLDGVNDYLLVADNPNLRSSAISIFALARFRGTIRSDLVACGNSQAFFSNNYILGFNSSTTASFFGRTPAAQLTGAIANVRNVLTAIANNSLSRIDVFANTASIIAQTPATVGTDNTTGLFIGCSIAITTPASFANGVLQEVIIYPSDQSTTRTAIEANINAHYSVY